MTEVATESLMRYANALRETLPNIPNKSRMTADILTTRERMTAIAKNTTTVTGAALFHELIGGLGTTLSQLCLEYASLAAPGNHGHRGRAARGLLDAVTYNASLQDHHKPARENDAVLDNIVRGSREISVP